MTHGMTIIRLKCERLKSQISLQEHANEGPQQDSQNQLRLDIPEGDYC